MSSDKAKEAFAEMNATFENRKIVQPSNFIGRDACELTFSDEEIKKLCAKRLDVPRVHTYENGNVTGLNYELKECKIILRHPHNKQEIPEASVHIQTAYPVAKKP